MSIPPHMETNPGLGEASRSVSPNIITWTAFIPTCRDSVGALCFGETQLVTHHLVPNVSVQTVHVQNIQSSHHAPEKKTGLMEHLCGAAFNS